MCVDSGDIVLAHPWLAHGIGINTSSDARLACYCRLHSYGFWQGGRAKMAGKKLNHPREMPEKWVGDYWAGIPGLRSWIDKNGGYIEKYDNG